MLSITKIRALLPRGRPSKGRSYSRYLAHDGQREAGSFADYARGESGGPVPRWACRGPALLGLDDIAQAEHVERLAKGLHPFTGAPLVKGAGDSHVVGLDMTFSVPKDVSAVFAGADPSTRAAIAEQVQEAARAALGYAESAAVVRKGHGGRAKELAEAALAVMHFHLSSRALDPNLHVHGLMLNVGKRRGCDEWSALEHRPQFDRKMATGILFRAELASRMAGLGFRVVPAGPYFEIEGIDPAQRDALSTRSREIARRLRETGSAGPAARDRAALATRAAKSEPGYGELIERFEAQAAELGITPASVLAIRGLGKGRRPAFSIDHAELLDELMASQSCATSQEALASICEKAMGRWDAARCLHELERFLAHGQVVRLGRDELLTEVITSRATKKFETLVSRTVADGASSRAHRVEPEVVAREFDRLEAELRGKLGVEVSLAQQRGAALHVASGTGLHAFVEGWAGTGKTTMLKALGAAYREAGFDVSGCCQSASASLNLSRETGIPSRTVASLLWAAQEGKLQLGPRSILVLDEAGMVGSRELGLLQSAAMAAGAKLVCVGDPKQLQPIEAGGIFGSLMRAHGKAEISNIQRQRTDFEPLLAWLAAPARGKARLDAAKAAALRGMPEDARMDALRALCGQAPKLARAFEKWKGRFDFEWMREAVELFARGQAREALSMLDGKGRLRLCGGAEEASEELVADWDRDKTPLASKAILAGTRVEVAELNRLARARLVDKGLVDDASGVELEILDRDGAPHRKRFAPGDRLVFLQNDRGLGVANGTTGTVSRVDDAASGARLSVDLDEPNERGERRAWVPALFARFDHAYCLTCHKGQGRTFDAAYVLTNPAMADREWTYVAASRSRFATTLYADASALGACDPDAHGTADAGPRSHEALLDALALRMRRSRAKGTTLDYVEQAKPAPRPPSRMATVSGARLVDALSESAALARWLGRPGAAPAVQRELGAER